MTQVDRLTKLTSQLVGDISRLPGVTLDAAGESQLVQLLTDAFEQVGLVALDGWQTPDLFADGLPVVHHIVPVKADAGRKSCDCGPGQSCHTCLPLPGGITF